MPANSRPIRGRLHVLIACLPLLGQLKIELLRSAFTIDLGRQARGIEVGVFLRRQWRELRRRRAFLIAGRQSSWCVDAHLILARRQFYGISAVGIDSSTERSALGLKEIN